MKEISQTARHATIYMIGAILNKIVSFVMLPIYTRYLSPSDYGTIELLFVTIDILSVVVGLGVSLSLFRFYNLAETKKEKNSVVSTMVFLLISLYLVAASGGIALSSHVSQIVFKSHEFTYYLKLIFLGFFFQIFIEFPFSYLRLIQKSVLYVSINAIKLVIQLSLNIYFIIYLDMKVTGVLYSTLLSSGFIGIIMMSYTLREVGFSFSPRLAYRFLVFGAPFIFANIGDFILTYSDRYFLNAFGSLKHVGIYALAYKMGFVLWVLVASPIFNIWNPKRFEIAENSDQEEINKRVFRYLNLVMISGAVFISIFSSDFFMITSNSVYWDAYKIVPIIMLAYVIQGWSDFFKFGMVYRAKTKYIAVGTILAAVGMLVSCYFLVPVWGMYGAAVATAVAFFIRFQFFYLASQSLYKINSRWGKNLLVFSFGVMAVTIAMIYKKPGFSQSILLHSGIFAVYLFIVFLSPAVSRNEKQYILDTIKSYRKPAVFWSR